MPLELKQLGVAPWPEALFFGSAQLALDHMVNHLLTAPESVGWAFLFKRRGWGAAWASDAARFRTARQFLTSEESSQDLYAQYHTLAGTAVSSAVQVGWHWDDLGARKFFGLEGILVIANPMAVCSAMLPGQGIPVSEHRRPTEGSPLPRQRGSGGQSSLGFGGRHRRRLAHEVREREEWALQKGGRSGLAEEDQDGWLLFFRCATGFCKSNHMGLTIHGT